MGTGGASTPGGAWIGVAGALAELLDLVGEFSMRQVPLLRMFRNLVPDLQLLLPA